MALDLLCIADTDGYFCRLNPQFERVLGYSCEELTSKPFLEYVHPDDVESTAAAIATLSAERPLINFVNRYRCKDGGYRWIEWRSALSGKMVYSAARDITERKKAADAINQLNEQLDAKVKERTAELEAKNRELERLNEVFVGRELRLLELKERIRELENRIQESESRSQKKE